MSMDDIDKKAPCEFTEWMITNIYNLITSIEGGMDTYDDSETRSISEMERSINDYFQPLFEEISKEGQFKMTIDDIDKKAPCEFTEWMLTNIYNLISSIEGGMDTYNDSET